MTGCSYGVGVLKNLSCDAVISIYISCAVAVLLLIIAGLSITICCLAARIRILSRRCRGESVVARGGGSIPQETELKEQTIAAPESTAMKETIQDMGVDAMYDVITSDNMTRPHTSESTPSAKKAPSGVKYEDVIVHIEERPSSSHEKNKKLRIASSAASHSDKMENTTKSTDSLTAVYSVPNKKKQKNVSSVAVTSLDNEEYSHLKHGTPSKQQPDAARALASTLSDNMEQQYSRIDISYQQPSSSAVIPPLPPPLQLDDPVLQENAESVKKSQSLAVHVGTVHSDMSVQDHNEVLYTNTVSLGL